MPSRVSNSNAGAKSQSSQSLTDNLISDCTEAELLKETVQLKAGLRLASPAFS